MKALITGVNGFAGKYLYEYLGQQGIEVYGTDINIDKSESSIGFYHSDLLDAGSIDHVIAQVAPNAIYHLAGLANVGISWEKPALSIQINTMGTVNLMDAVRRIVPAAKMLIVGSADQYGIVSPEMCPLKEDMILNPVSPYALSKTMQEEAARFYISHFGLHIILVRAFNHIGPGQKLGFVVPDFASRIARIEQGKLDRLEVGNLSAQRDFSDVRDIVRGYFLLMEKGFCGEVYNIGSGRARKISDILKQLLSYSDTEIEVFEDPNKMRPSDAPMIYGDIEKIKQHTGYAPTHKLENTLEEIMTEWRLRVQNGL